MGIHGKGFPRLILRDGNGALVELDTRLLAALDVSELHRNGRNRCEQRQQWKPAAVMVVCGVCLVSPYLRPGPTGSLGEASGSIIFTLAPRFSLTCCLVKNDLDYYELFGFF